MLTGIDVSHYNPDRDWAACHRAGAAYVMHKVIEGTTPDPTFIARWPRIRSCGAIPGAYSFPHDGDPAGQARRFLDLVGAVEGVLLMVDYEPSLGRLASLSTLRTHVETIHDETGGHPVLIYYPHWVWEDQGKPGGLSGLGPLVASDYLAAPPATLTLADAARVPSSWWAGYGGWARPAVIQYAGEAGRCVGTADLNLFDGDLADLLTLTGGDMFDDTDKERLRQLWAVNGTAYAASERAGDNPVKDIGQQVWETHETVGKLATAGVDAAALAELLAGPLGAALAGNEQLITRLADAVSANLAKRLES